MKRAVSVSLGPSRRDHEAEITILGERVHVERVGTDGDLRRAARLFAELDGRVDALGVGGARLRFEVGDAAYPLHSYLPVVRDVRRTPLVDGSALIRTMEPRLASTVERHLDGGDEPRRVLVTVATDRWHMMSGFLAAGWSCVFGDLMFALAMPVAMRSAATLRRVAALLFPVISRVPLAWMSPTGKGPERPGREIERWCRWATVIAGDAMYLLHRMPARLDGKIVCTNTTTAEDVERFHAAGVRLLVTSTPVLDGRTFGTNLLEAALVAASGRGRALTPPEIADLLARGDVQPAVRRLAG